MEYLVRNQFFLFAAYALTYIVVESSVFSYPRNLLQRISWFEKLLSCWFCSGFWCSMITSVLYFVAYSQPLKLHLWSDLLLHSLAGAAFIFLTHESFVALTTTGVVATPIPQEEFDKIAKEAEQK